MPVTQTERFLAECFQRKDAKTQRRREAKNSEDIDGDSYQRRGVSMESPCTS